MYTIVYHKEDLTLIDTMQTNTFPKVGDVRVPYYIQEGEFDGVVDPSKGLDSRSEIQILREENEALKKDNEMNAMAIMELTNMVLGG